MRPEAMLLGAGFAAVTAGVWDCLAGGGAPRLLVSIGTAAALWLCGLCLGLAHPREGGSK